MTVSTLSVVDFFTDPSGLDFLAVSCVAGGCSLLLLYTIGSCLASSIVSSSTVFSSRGGGIAAFLSSSPSYMLLIGMADALL